MASEKPQVLPVQASLPVTAFRQPTPPPKGKYKLLALLDAPKRFMRPGCTCEDVESATKVAPVDKLGGATAGNVRGVTRTRLCDLALDDVIAGKHTPPLTLRDFEDFLAFKTKSAENLYFELFMRKYVKLYETSKPHLRSATQTALLKHEYELCLSIFFDPSSPLELNTSADLRKYLQDAISSTTGEPFLAPEAFAKIRHDSNEMLGTSFKAFLQNQARNADRNRAIFAQCLGLATWAIGLVPTIVACVLDKSRAWRALGLFFWWFGIVVFIGGFKRTCLVIYLFGDSRQLYPWELSSLDDTHTMTIYAESVAAGEWETTDQSPIFDEGYASASPPESPATESPVGSPRRRSTAYSGLGYFPVFEPRSPSLSGSELSEKPSQKASSTPSKLYFAPNHILPTIAASSPTWAPFTRVLSPFVCREQRDTVLSAAGIALLVTIVTSAICFSVPNKHH